MRLFISVNFDEETKDALCRHIEALRGIADSGNFTRRSNLHLTLAFIGEALQIGGIVDTIDSINMDRFQLKLAGTGKFKRSGGDIYWVGVEKNPQLILLHKLLTRSLARKGIVLDKNEFKPHLTLGREVVLSEYADTSVLDGIKYDKPVSVDRVSLMKSERINGVLTYTEIYSKELKSTT